jgi:1-deoxy-D-xylulose-5-phosphate reductoisomerase
MAGELIMREAKRRRVRVIPVDSEHSAVFQCLRGERKNEVRKIILTASGGPFLGYSGTRLQSVTVEEALNHPNWDMGPKITIDSATLMNKGLEVIEARWIFDLSPEQIEVLIHPQSIVHSMVEFQDGSVMGQLGLPDMKVPISFALSYPKRLPNSLPSLDLSRIGRLSFDKPDYANFPCLGLAFDALRMGGTAPAVLNAANEETVQSFLNGEIPFPQIGRINAAVLHSASVQPIRELAEVVRADQEARRFARELIQKKTRLKKSLKTPEKQGSARFLTE